jgi:hypothetical protein
VYLLIAASFIIALAAVGLPLLAIVVVSMGSVREENQHSLGDEAPGLGQGIARRIVGFRTANIGALAPGQMPKSAPRWRPEVGLAYASRTVSAAGQQRAVYQSQAHRIRPDQRERAGV